MERAGSQEACAVVMHTDICSPFLRHILQIVNFSDKWWKVETVVLVVFL